MFDWVIITSLNLYTKVVLQSGLSHSCSFVNLTSDIPFCVYKTLLKSRLNWRKRWLNQKLPFEINNSYYFSGKTPWKFYSYSDRFSKKEASFHVFVRFPSERRKDVPFLVFIWSRWHYQLSCNYPITVPHTKFTIMTWITKSIIKAWLLFVWTRFTTLPLAEQLMSPYITSSSKRVSPYEGSICTWSCMLVCNCIAAASTNQTGQWVHKMFPAWWSVCGFWILDVLRAVLLTDPGCIAMLVARYTD